MVGYVLVIRHVRVSTYLPVYVRDNNQTSKGGHIMFIENETFKDKDKDKIVVWKRTYKQLVEDSRFLQCLEEAGVDNWDGYADAMDRMGEE